MSAPEVSNTTLQVKESLFKRYENLTVLSIFATFVAIVVVVQLISTGGTRFPTFISPVNIVNILQQVAVPGIVAISMTMVMVSGGISSARIGDVTVTARDGRTVVCATPDCASAHILLDFSGPVPASLLLVEQRYGLPQSASGVARARPDWAVPSGQGDMTFIAEDVAIPQN